MLSITTVKPYDTCTSIQLYDRLKNNGFFDVKSLRLNYINVILVPLTLPSPNVKGSILDKDIK